MAKYRKKPVIVEAVQWFKNGDHPEDKSEPIKVGPINSFRSEGKIVRRFRHPEVSGTTECKYCGKTMQVHGWIETLEGGHIVCPGDWIITGVQGERYPVKDIIFRKTYEPVKE